MLLVCRGAETFGEDPLLASRMAAAYVRGMQWGPGGQQASNGFLKTGVTCKHFAAYSLEEDQGVSRLEFNAVVDPRWAAPLHAQLSMPLGNFVRLYLRAQYWFEPVVDIDGMPHRCSLACM